MKKSSFITGLFVMSFLVSGAQNVSTGNSNPDNRVSVNTYRCGTMQHLQWIQQQDPSLKQKMELEEQKFNDYIAAHPNELKNNKTSYTIPVVVHVVYNGSSGYVSSARVQEQIDQTNSDWAGTNGRSMQAFPDSLRANTGISLCLATIDPFGNVTTGIKYRQTTVSSFGFNDNVKHNSTGGADAWDVTKYINIWVCNLGSGLCGYAQFPTSGINSTFGVVIHYQFFGITGAVAPYNGGATMSHELGHCFNLSHIWNDTTCTDGDGCPDTPTQYGNYYGPYGGCITDFCTDTCPGIMYMDFMNYSEDNVMANLTPDQSARMQACVQMYLMSVANNASAACGIQTPCTSYFYLYPDTATLHHYYAVNMANGSGQLTYFWDWGDGNYDTIPYPSHLYDSAGYYNICLTIADTTGCTSTYCDSSYYIQKSENSVIYIDVIPQGSVGIHENLINHNIILYPNPAENNITVENSSAILSENILSIYDLQGKLMLNQVLKKTKTLIDISPFARGLYMVKVENSTGVELKKFIKE